LDIQAEERKRQETEMRVKGKRNRGLPKAKHRWQDTITIRKDFQ